MHAHEEKTALVTISVILKVVLMPCVVAATLDSYILVIRQSKRKGKGQVQYIIKSLFYIPGQIVFSTKSGTQFSHGLVSTT